MRTRTSALVLATSLALGGTASLALAPTLAMAADAAGSSVSSRATKIADALKGLVSDGTITQAQADKVAATLDKALPQGGPGGMGGRHGGGPRLDEAATIIGLTADEIRTQLEAGKTLAQIAATKGVSKATLINKLVAAAEAHLAQEVKDGRLTQAEANTRKADLKTRITEMVDRVGMPARGHGGPGGQPPAASSSGGSGTTTSSYPTT